MWESAVVVCDKHFVWSASLHHSLYVVGKLKGKEFSIGLKIHMNKKCQQLKVHLLAVTVLFQACQKTVCKYNSIHSFFLC